MLHLGCCDACDVSKEVGAGRNPSGSDGIPTDRCTTTTLNTAVGVYVDAEEHIKATAQDSRIAPPCNKAIHVQSKRERSRPKEDLN